VPEAPAASRGLTITGKPTRCTKARTSFASLVPIDWAQAMPAARSVSFMAGLSRQRKAVRTLVPGIWQRSRTLAAVWMWASTVVSSRSTQPRPCTRRTASKSAPSSTTERTCS
jgi:hypothetical protein